MTSASETQELEKGVFLTIKSNNQTTSEGEPMTVHIFTVDSKFLVELNVMIDFTGSSGISIENGDGLVVTTVIEAESTDTVAIVKENSDSQMTWQVSWYKVKPPLDRI